MQAWQMQHFFRTKNPTRSKQLDLMWRPCTLIKEGIPIKTFFNDRIALLIDPDPLTGTRTVFHYKGNAYSDLISLGGFDYEPKTGSRKNKGSFKTMGEKLDEQEARRSGRIPDPGFHYYGRRWLPYNEQLGTYEISGIVGIVVPEDSPTAAYNALFAQAKLGSQSPPFYRYHYRIGHLTQIAKAEVMQQGLIGETTAFAIEIIAQRYGCTLTVNELEQGHSLSIKASATQMVFICGELDKVNTRYRLDDTILSIDLLVHTTLEAELHSKLKVLQKALGVCRLLAAENEGSLPFNFDCVAHWQNETDFDNPNAPLSLIFRHPNIPEAVYFICMEEGVPTVSLLPEKSKPTSQFPDIIRAYFRHGYSLITNMLASPDGLVLLQNHGIASLYIELHTGNKSTLWFNVRFDAPKTKEEARSTIIEFLEPESLGKVKDFSSQVHSFRLVTNLISYDRLLTSLRNRINALPISKISPSS